jgi:hypothetical protein
MADDTDKPMVVNSDPTSALIMTTVRGALGPVLATMAHDGYITGDQVQLILSVAAGAAVLAWQLWVSFRKSRKTLHVAQAHPSDVQIK